VTIQRVADAATVLIKNSPAAAHLDAIPLPAVHPNVALPAAAYLPSVVVVILAAPLISKKAPQDTSILLYFVSFTVSTTFPCNFLKEHN